MFNVVRPFRSRRRKITVPRVTADDLKGFKAPEFAEKDEGYGGRLIWNASDKKSLAGVKAFVMAVECGDREKISELLGSISNVDVGQLEYFMDLLLDDGATLESLKEALLTAILIGSRPLVEMCLGLFNYYQFDERQGCADSAAFSPHVTPLLLACSLNNFAIVECLLLRGHQLELPHMKTCECGICYKSPQNVRNDKRIVDTMRAMCSDAYLWLATHDPFAAACALAEDVQQYADEDNFRFKDQYEAMLAAIDRFLCRFIDCAWSTDELRVVLDRRAYCPVSLCEMPLPRVQLAMSSGIKHLITTPNVQEAMSTAWLSDWCQFGAGRIKRDLYRLSRHSLFYPIMSLLFILSNGKIAKSFNVPLARYITRVASYGTFLIALVIIRYLKLYNVNKALELMVEMYFYAYVMGMLFERYIVYSRIGPEHYLKHWWRWFDGFLIFFFVITITVWVGSLAEGKEDFKLNIAHQSNSNYTALYDILLAVCCILAVSKIFYFMQLFKGVGSTVISVGKCVGSIYNYLFVMLLVIVAFAIGLNLIQTPFIDKHSIDPNTGEDIVTKAAHKDIGYSIRSLFWGFFGYFSPDESIVVAGNNGPTQQIANYAITNATLEILTGMYYIMLVLMLLNLMISLLVKKAEEVLENEDSEYKYTRAAIYSEYFSWESATPPPLNIIALPFTLIYKFILSGYSIKWPEIFINKNCSPFNEEEMSKEIEREARYIDLLVKMFARFRASHEVHFRTACNHAFDKNQKDSPAKVYFLSDEQNLTKQVLKKQVY